MWNVCYSRPWIGPAVVMLCMAAAFVMGMNLEAGRSNPSRLSQAMFAVRVHRLPHVFGAVGWHKPDAGFGPDRFAPSARPRSKLEGLRGNVGWKVAQRDNRIHADARTSLMSSGLFMVGFLGALLGFCLGNGCYVTPTIALMSTSGTQSRTCERWRRLKCALLTYRLQYNDLNVPSRFVIPNSRDWAEDLWGMKLGSTVSRIRNRGDYSTYRGELQEMGFSFDSQRTVHGWEKVSRALLTYQSLHEDLLVPRDFVIPNGRDWAEDLWDMRLGVTVSNIRNGGDYSEYRAELEEMGFSFDSQRAVHGWEKVKRALLTYKSLHGDLLVPKDFLIPNSTDWAEDLCYMQLGVTVYSIRNKACWSTHRAELEEMGFSFDSQSTGHGWEKVKLALLTYKLLHGDLLVPRRFVIPNGSDWPEDLWGMKLGEAASNIRNKRCYSQYRAQLEEMGFSFDSQRAVHGWEKVSRALLTYKSLHGDLLVPKDFLIPNSTDWAEDLCYMQLGVTVDSIRNKACWSTHRAELEEMGFSFDSQRAVHGWEKVSRALLTYKSLHGDLLVPKDFLIPNSTDWAEDLCYMQLGVTVDSIRNKACWSTHRAELEEMGFSFDSQRAGHGWEKVSRALLMYKSLHGDLLVPRSFVIPSGSDWPEDLWGMKLGEAASNIRNKRCYSQYRAQLEEMGFSFDSQRTVHGWEKVSRALLTYQSLHEDLLVPIDFVIPNGRDWAEDLWDMRLGVTVSNIRNQGYYATYRAELEEMGFSFDSQRTGHGGKR